MKLKDLYYNANYYLELYYRNNNFAYFKRAMSYYLEYIFRNGRKRIDFLDDWLIINL